MLRDAVQCASFQSLDKIVQSRSVLVGSVNDQIVALDIDNGMCFGLNAVGSEVWRRIAEPVSIREVCLSLCEVYEVDYETCESQVVELLHDLLAEGLVKVV